MKRRTVWTWALLVLLGGVGTGTFGVLYGDVSGGVVNIVFGIAVAAWMVWLWHHEIGSIPEKSR